MQPLHLKKKCNKRMSKHYYILQSELCSSSTLYQIKQKTTQNQTNLISNSIELILYCSFIKLILTSIFWILEANFEESSSQEVEFSVIIVVMILFGNLFKIKNYIKELIHRQLCLELLLTPYFLKVYVDLYTVSNSIYEIIIHIATYASLKYLWSYQITV